jgi:hypothetical protein
MNKETVDKVVAAAKTIVVACAKAAAVGAAVAALTVVINAAPALGAEFSLSPAATGQVVAIAILARDAIKTKGG